MTRTSTYLKYSRIEERKNGLAPSLGSGTNERTSLELEKQFFFAIFTYFFYFLHYIGESLMGNISN